MKSALLSKILDTAPKDEAEPKDSQTTLIMGEAGLSGKKTLVTGQVDEQAKEEEAEDADEGADEGAGEEEQKDDDAEVHD